MEDSHGEFTRLLQQETPSYDRLLPLVYDELRRIAAFRLRSERDNHTLSPTALVSEAYLRLTHNASITWSSRAHFYHVASRAMSRILIDHARTRGRIKRTPPTTLPQARSVTDFLALDDSESILILSDAIDRLDMIDESLGSVVRLRFYAGLSVEETALALAVSTATVKRRWNFARAWLIAELKDALPLPPLDDH